MLATVVGGSPGLTIWENSAAPLASLSSDVTEWRELSRLYTVSVPPCAMVMFAGVNARLPGSIVTVADVGTSRGDATFDWSGIPAATGVGPIDPGAMTD